METNKCVDEALDATALERTSHQSKQRDRITTTRQKLALIICGLVCTCFVALSVEISGRPLSDEKINHGCQPKEPRVVPVVLRPNNTAYAFVRQYAIGNDGKRVTVCVYQDRVKIMCVKSFVIEPPSKE